MQSYQDWRPTTPGNSKTKTVTFQDQPRTSVRSDPAAFVEVKAERDVNGSTSSHSTDEPQVKRLSPSLQHTSRPAVHSALSKKRDAAMTQDRWPESVPSRKTHPISHAVLRSQEARVLPNGVVTAGPDDDRKKPWYVRVHRQEAEIRLKKYADGTFIVRPTKHGGERDHCFTLSIIFKRRIFHVAIRKRMDDKWALGPPKPDEQTYDSVVQMIEYHRRVPIIIHADNKVVGSTRLVCWPLESAC